MNLGVVQGRISPPVFGEIQEFPFSSWETEFRLLEELSLSHVEWIVTKSSFKKNPIFYKNLIPYAINSVCVDNVIDYKFYERDFLESNLKPVCDAAIKNGIENITIPLLEFSSICDQDRREKFTKNIISLAKEYQELNFSFETENTKPEILKNLVYESENFFITYDTGNITSSGINHSEFLEDEKIIKKINNVHLKDRTFSGKTVYFGNGDTDFSSIFGMLKSAGYKGVYTLQGARDVIGYEVDTVKKYINYIEEIYGEE